MDTTSSLFSEIRYSITKCCLLYYTLILPSYHPGVVKKRHFSDGELYCMWPCMKKVNHSENGLLFIYHTIFLISMSWIIYLFADELANWHNGTLKLQKQILIPWGKTNDNSYRLYNMDSSIIWCLGKPDFVTTYAIVEVVLITMYLVKTFHTSGFLKKSYIKLKQTLSS